MVSAGPRLIVSVFSAFGLSDRISVRRALSPTTQDGFSRPPPYRLCIFSIRPLRPDLCPTGAVPSDPGWFQPAPALSSVYSALGLSDQICTVRLVSVKAASSQRVRCLLFGDIAIPPCHAGVPRMKLLIFLTVSAPALSLVPDELTAPLAGRGAVSREPGPGRSLLVCALPPPSPRCLSVTPAVP